MNDFTNKIQLSQVKDSCTAETTELKRESKFKLAELTTQFSEYDHNVIQEIRYLSTEFQELSEHIYLNMDNWVIAIKRSQKELTEWLIRIMTAIIGLAVAVLTLF